MAADQTLQALASQAAPLDYPVPGAVELILKSLKCSFDGTGAAGPYVPCVQLLIAGDVEDATYPLGSSVAAGASADVSWFPRSGGGVGTGGSGIRFDTYPQTGDWLYVDTTGESPHGGSSVVFTDAPFGYSFTSSDPSGSGDSQFDIEVDGANNSGAQIIVNGDSNSGMELAVNGSGSSPIKLTTNSGAGTAITNVGGSTGIGITDDSSGGLNMSAVGSQGVSIKGTAGSLPLIGALTGNSVTVQAGNSVDTSGNIAIGAVADGSAPLDTIALICLGEWEFGTPSPTPYAGIVLICALDNSISVDDGAGNTLMQILHSGQIQMAHLPSSNPGGSGLLWNNGGVVNIT